jgi:HD-GYP domain-containing protein (c-di-GMP phosphodiesterase class II)
MILGNLGAQDDAPSVAELLYDEGVKFYVLSQFEDARTKLEQAYNLDSESATIRNMYVNSLIKLGTISMEAGESEKALSLFLRADQVSDNPEVKASLNELIVLLRPEEAIAQQAPLQNGTAVANTSGTQGSTTTGVQQDPLTSSTTQQGITSSQNVPNTSSGVVTPNINIEVPIDLEESLVAITQENIKIIEALVEQRALENQQFAQSMSQLLDSQQDERDFFQTNILAILIGAGVLILLVLLIIVIVIRNQNRVPMQMAGPAYRQVGSMSAGDPTMISAGGVDERLMIGNENYEEAVKAKKLSEFNQQLKSGNMDFDSMQRYIGELNMEIKMELLDLVDKRLKENKKTDQISSLLLPFMGDAKQEVQQASQKLLKQLSDKSQSFFDQEVESDVEGILSIASLTNYGQMIDAKTGRAGHAVKVSRFVYEIAKRLDDKSLDPEEAAKAALIYDIGFLEVSPDIMNKTSALSPEEFAVMRSHTEIGLRFFSHVELPDLYVHAIRFHHERMDGSGYPQGLAGENIPLVARCIAVADMFNAATSPRPYKNALTPELAINMMQDVSGELIDENIFRALKQFLVETENLEIG